MQQERLMELDTPDKKTEWLESISRDLAGEPRVEWAMGLQSLKDGFSIFQGDFGYWIEFGILANLVKLFKPAYSNLNLGSEAAVILSNVIYLGK